MIWAPIRYSYRTVNNELPVPAPAPPCWMMTLEQRCAHYAPGVDDRNCTVGNCHWLGTDDQGRDVVARLIYGFRISVLFGLTLTIVSSIIGVVAGAVQGYLRRLDRSPLPALHRDLDLDPLALPAAHHLLGASRRASSCCSAYCCSSRGWRWSGVVRAEFLRGRNFEYVNAARALGVSNFASCSGTCCRTRWWRR